MNNCMKVTDTLILCLKCIHEEMWGKNIIKAIANVVFSKKNKIGTQNQSFSCVCTLS